MRPSFGLLALLVVLAACATSSPAGSAPGSAERANTTAAGSDTPAAGEVTSTTTPPPPGETVVLDVVLDGDSLAVIRNGERTEVRLAGINTPERDECFGDQAKGLMQSVAGDELTLVQVQGDDDQDQFGRLLRDVWSGGTWLNHLMVEQGAAIALQTGSPNEPQLVAAEDAAWTDGLGLWGTSVCGEFAPGVEISDIRYDPPGRDFENPEEEFVVLENRRDVAVAMSGWILRDESSTHRFRFADDFTLEPGATVRVRTGCGTSDDRDLYWCADDAVWSNGGDSVILQAAGGTVVDRWKYTGDF